MACEDFLGDLPRILSEFLGTAPWIKVDFGALT